LAKCKVFTIIHPPLSAPAVASSLTSIIKEQYYNNLLSEIALSLSTASLLSFYTDGSLIHPTTDDCKMGIGWICIPESLPQVFFNASIENWVSSTRAEIFAILTALIVFPRNSTISIYSDSLATILGYESYVTNHNFSVRTNEKVPNYTLWLTIKYIVDHLNLNVSLVKVKGHSDDVYNNIADHIAKSGTQLPPLSINYLKIPSINILFNFNQIPIESSIRYFLKYLFDASNFSAILDLQRNEELKLLT
jgi:ribonuclease HI